MNRETLVLTPGFRGGSWVMLLRALRAAPALGEPSLRTTALGAGPPGSPPDGVPVERLPWPEYDRVAHRVEASAFGTLLFCGPIALYVGWRLLHHLRDHRPVSILTNGVFLAGTAALAARMAGGETAVFAWVHADIGTAGRRTSRAYVRWLQRLVAGFFVNSEDVRDDLHAAGVPPERVVFVPNWVDPATERAPVPRALAEQLRSFEFRAIYVGRFVEYKHVRTYLEAARRFASPRRGVVFVGDGELLPELRSAAAQNPAIVVVDPVPNATARTLMAGANVTLAYADTTYVSSTAMESLAEGTPVIYPEISCAPEKYAAGVRIERELLPAPAGERLPAQGAAIAAALEARALAGAPSVGERTACEEIAKARYSPGHARPILRSLARGRLVREAGA